MAGEISKENGKKGGRPKGSIDLLAAARKEAHAQFVKEAQKHLPEMIDALIHVAKGIIIETENDDGTTRVYSKAPDVQALREYFDRIMGKPKQDIGIEPGDDVDMTIIFTKREKELRDRYAKKAKASSEESK